ncbi:MAG: PTS sugar transporter subunit IIA [Anaerolineaceae bacterium]
MELINESLIALDIDISSKLSVFEKIADLLDESGRMKDRQQYIQDVLEREKIVSTYIGDLMVIPHARSCAISDASLVYLRLNKPIDWNNSEMTRYIFGIAVPAENVENRYLEILSSFARKLLDDTIRPTIFESKSKKEIIDALLG